MSYYNTTNRTGDELKSFKWAAESQEQVIFDWFLGTWRTYAEFSFSPSHVNKEVLPKAPITSVRRAMTNLTKRGLLVKTDTYVDGPHGRKEGTWRLA